MAPKPNAPKAPENTPATSTPATDAIAKLMAMLGTAQYSHESGAVTLYADKRRAGVKNGRAGHVTFTTGNWSIPCSVYMDVEEKTENGVTGESRTYRLSFPKGVKAIFSDGSVEKKFKRAHLDAWKLSRTQTALTADATDDGASVSEFVAKKTE